MNINESESRQIIKEVNAIIDRHAGQDYELMAKLEFVVFDMLIVIEQNLIDEMAPDFLHHLFIGSRLFKNPVKREELRKSFKKMLRERREKSV